MARRAAGSRQIVDYAASLKADLGAKEAARALGVSPSTLYRTLRGEGLRSQRTVTAWRDRAFVAPQRIAAREVSTRIEGVKTKDLARALGVSQREAGRIKREAREGTLAIEKARRVEKLETTITADSGEKVRLVISPQAAERLHSAGAFYGKRWESAQDAANDIGSSTARNYLVIVGMPDGSFAAFDIDMARHVGRAR